MDHNNDVPSLKFSGKDKPPNPSLHTHTHTMHLMVAKWTDFQHRTNLTCRAAIYKYLDSINFYISSMCYMEITMNDKDMSILIFNVKILS